MEKLGFIQFFNYLDHSGMSAMLEGENGDKLLELAENISVCLHEDWKSNLVREKGKDYQHFRPVKDAEFAKMVIANKDEYLSLVSEDGKPLYKINETINNGEISYDVQFDLIRVPFENLTKKWQGANSEAAKFALCLVKTAADNGSLNATGNELFLNFEAMAHDIHLEWMFREGDWAAVELLLPYELLTVDTNGYNQKDKDRAHVVATTAELTFQPNILARNRSIVIRAVNELFKENAKLGGLNPEIMRNIANLQTFIDEKNNEDFEAYLAIKRVVMEKALSLLTEKTELSFEDLEILSATYFETWRKSVKNFTELPKTVDVNYDNILVDDARVNHKNIARTEVKKILSEMVKEQILDEGIGTSLTEIADKNSKLGKRIVNKNETDFLNYLATIQSTNN